MRGPARAILAAAALAASAALPACNIVTPVMYIAQGPGKKPAEYTLPKDRKLVVFVDDRRSVMSRLQLRSTLADDIGTVIQQLELVKEVVSGRELIAYVRRVESPSKRVSIEELGNAVGADVVLYVEMDAFALTPDGATPKPTALARVKVVDVEKRERLFPPAGGDPAGVTVQAEINALAADAYRTSANRRKLEDALAKRLADQITKLFYEHEAKNFGGGVSTIEG